MHRHRAVAIALVALVSFLPACGGGASVSPDIQSALQTGEHLRESCVASALDLLQNVADMVSLAATARDLDALAAAADAAACSLWGPDEGSYTFFCAGLPVRGEPVDVLIELTYLDDLGFPTDDLSAAASVLLRIEAEGGLFQGGGVIHIAPDAELGLVFDGSIGTVYYDGCSATADLLVTGQTVADLPDLAAGVLFTSGDVDLGAETPEGRPVSGSAGLVGRTAVVVLEVDGVISQGEIALGE
jgi:hypothetical protein